MILNYPHHHLDDVVVKLTKHPNLFLICLGLIKGFYSWKWKIFFRQFPFLMLILLSLISLLTKVFTARVNSHCKPHQKIQAARFLETKLCVPRHFAFVDATVRELGQFVSLALTNLL